MDLTVIFAVKMLAAVACILLGLVLGSFISAIWLRLSAVILRMGNVLYWRALQSALISNFVVLVLHFSNGFNHGFTTAIVGIGTKENFASRATDLAAYQYSAIYFLWASIAGLLLVAAIFCRIIPGDGDRGRMRYTDALALASLYFALSFAFMLVLGLLALAIVVGLLELMG